jgi:hypothetical protein
MFHVEHGIILLERVYRLRVASALKIVGMVR